MSEPLLTDDEVTALIEDPAKITTHEIAMHVITVLDSEIASIQAQVDAAIIESNAKPLTEDRQAWLRRASYAGAIRKGQRHRVTQRDKEIRGTKNPANMEPKVSKEEKLLKHQRLLEEAQARKAKSLFAIEQLKTEQARLRVAPLSAEIARLKDKIDELEDALAGALRDGDTGE